MGQLAHSKVVDNEQRHEGQFGQIVLAGLGERGLGQLLEEGMGVAVEGAVALLHGGAAVIARAEITESARMARLPRDPKRRRETITSGSTTTEPRADWL